MEGSKENNHFTPESLMVEKILGQKKSGTWDTRFQSCCIFEKLWWCHFSFSEPIEGLQPISPQFFDTLLYQMKFHWKYQRKPQNQTLDLFSHIEPLGWQPRVPGDMAPKKEPEKEALKAAAPGSLECLYGIIYIFLPCVIRVHYSCLGCKRDYFPTLG